MKYNSYAESGIQMESMREESERLKKLEKSLDELNRSLDARQKTLDARNKTLDKRTEILTLMKQDLEAETTPSKENINRFEGYFSYIVSYKLEDLIEEKNWFVGVMLSASILEDVGKRKIKRAFKGKIDSERIERLTIEQTTMMLLASGLVDAKTYQKLMDVKEVRNDLAHDSGKALLSFWRTGSEKDRSCQKYRSTIRKAIFCLKAIYPPVIPQAKKV